MTKIWIWLLAAGLFIIGVFTYASFLPVSAPYQADFEGRLAFESQEPMSLESSSLRVTHPETLPTDPGSSSVLSLRFGFNPNESRIPYAYADSVRVSPSPGILVYVRDRNETQLLGIRADRVLIPEMENGQIPVALIQGWSIAYDVVIRSATGVEAELVAPQNLAASAGSLEVDGKTPSLEVTLTSGSEGSFLEFEVSRLSLSVEVTETSEWIDLTVERPVALRLMDFD